MYASQRATMRAAERKTEQDDELSPWRTYRHTLVCAETCERKVKLTRTLREREGKLAAMGEIIDRETMDRSLFHCKCLGLCPMELGHCPGRAEMLSNGGHRELLDSLLRAEKIRCGGAFLRFGRAKNTMHIRYYTVKIAAD